MSVAEKKSQSRGDRKMATVNNTIITYLENPQ